MSWSRDRGDRAARARARRRLLRPGTLCGLAFNQCTKQATEIHHIIPWAQGGTDDETNLMPVCHTCHEQTTRSHVDAATRRWQAHAHHPWTKNKPPGIL